MVMFEFSNNNVKRYYSTDGTYVFKYAYVPKADADGRPTGEYMYVIKGKWLIKDFSPQIYDGVTDKCFHDIIKSLKLR